MTRLLKKTPWGTPQTQVEIAPGIVKYTTATHGGYHLSKSRNRMIPGTVKRKTFGGLGFYGWYEEDVDSAIVILVFAELFDKAQKQLAENCLQQFHPELLRLLSLEHFKSRQIQ